MTPFCKLLHRILRRPVEFASESRLSGSAILKGRKRLNIDTHSLSTILKGLAGSCQRERDMHPRTTNSSAQACDAQQLGFESAGALELVNEYSGYAVIPAPYIGFAELELACPWWRLYHFRRRAMNVPFDEQFTAFGGMDLPLLAKRPNLRVAALRRLSVYGLLLVCKYSV